MKIVGFFIIIILLNINTYSIAQQKNSSKNKIIATKKFPNYWYGHWIGKITWTTPKSDTPTLFTMQLIIKPTAIKNVITWQIQYGDSLLDVRPYTCKLIDSINKHWLIDENNGILIDLFIIGNSAFSCFNVQGNTISNNYQLQANGAMQVQFITSNTKAIRTSGLNTNNSPTVETFKIASFQVGTLLKINQTKNNTQKK